MEESIEILTHKNLKMKCFQSSDCWQFRFKVRLVTSFLDWCSWQQPPGKATSIQSRPLKVEVNSWSLCGGIFLKCSTLKWFVLFLFFFFCVGLKEYGLSNLAHCLPSPGARSSRGRVKLHRNAHPLRVPGGISSRCLFFLETNKW